MIVRSEQPLSRWTAIAVTCGAALLAFLGTLVRSDDPDMFHHLALGREIARAGWPPTLEPFLYPLAGSATGPAPYWLGSLVIHGWHALLGEPGVSFLPAAIGAVLAVILLLDARPRGGSHSLLTLACATLPIALALETYRYRAVARTEIFSAVLFAWTLWAIRRFEEGRPRALLVLPLVAIAWTNLHPATAIALVPLAILLAAGTAQLLLRRVSGVVLPGTLAWRSLAIVAAVAVGVAAASSITPAAGNPIAGAIRFAAATLGLDGGAAAAQDTAYAVVLASASELRGGGVELWTTPTGVLIALVALSFLLRPRSIRLREVVTVAAFAALPFVAVRFAMFFAVVAAPIAARNLGEAVAALPRRLGPLPFRAGAAGMLAASALASAPLGAQAPHIRFGAGFARGVFPVRAADYLASIHFDGRLYNTFQLGGYLEWRSVGAPFQDGRGGARPEDVAGATGGPLDPIAFAPLDARYQFDALLLAYPDPATTPLASLGYFDPDPSTWALVAFDDAALLYLRRGGKLAELAERDAFRNVTPANPVLALPPPDPAGALAEYGRSVAEAPDCFRCRFFLGEVALATGHPDVAATAVTPALARAHGFEREMLVSVAARADAARRTTPGLPAR